ncbi:MAG: DUF4093 domain-containing protein [Ruminococcaceae bacterium]|nr:DUF4093 domain-containing protein [Oscillospiraceae bacterium]
MIKLKETVIVEGKYDKIKLENFIDAYIIATNGFRIFKDTKKRELIKRLAKQNGIIILTDSDSAGMMIRNYLKGIVSCGEITNVYVPQIKGKEKRKDKVSAEGLLGVEGLSKEIIIEALEKSGVFIKKSATKSKKDIDKTLLFEYGLTGGAESSKRRKSLYEFLGLPSCMQTNSFLEYVNKVYEKNEFERVCNEWLNQQDSR